METLALYLLKSSLIAAAFFTIYWCFFRNQTFYRFNRYFLLTGLACAVFLPSYTFSYQIDSISQNNTAKSASPLGDAVPVWLVATIIVYAAGACILLIRHILGMYKIKQIIHNGNRIPLQGFKLIETPAFKSSFSVFNYIIINTSPQTSGIERKMILEHEQAHIMQRHWIDLLVSQLFCTAQWFNPFAWLYLNAIRQNHEYLADQAVLKSGNSPAAYHATLINHSLGTPAFTFASPFSRDDKLKRIYMMRKPPSVPTKKMAAGLILPALALLIFAFAKPEAKAGSDNNSQPLIYLDGREIRSIDIIDPKDIESINVLKGESAIAHYGEKGKNGVISITSKKH